MTKRQQSKIKKFLSIRNHGFLRVAVVIPKVYLADPAKNAKSHFDELKKVYQKGAAYAVCPELGLTGYSNSDLFFSDVLIDGAKKALKELYKIVPFKNNYISFIRIFSIVYFKSYT